MTTTFQRVAATSVGGFPGYVWSNAANWTNGVPVNGDTVVVNQSAPANPSGYDDIANLYLDALTLTQGYVAVIGSLEIGHLTFGTAGFAQVYASTLAGNGSAVLTVDSLGVSNGFGQVGATGPGAIANVLATTDPGGTYFADDGGEIELTATPNTASQYAFEDSVPSATIAFRNPGATIAAAIYGVEAGDAFALPGSSVSAVTFGASSLSITTNLGTTNFTHVNYTGATPTGYTDSVDAATGLERVTIACFCRGTRILTVAGEIEVEQLACGDKVLTASGLARPICWIGRRSYAGGFAAGNRTIMPVVIYAGALADGVPSRDLFVSPQHAMYLDGVLVPAAELVNGVSIVRLSKIEAVDYFHIELATHDVIVAEGAEAETFVDDDSRAMFQNAAEYAVLHPEKETGPALYYAARVTSGYTLEAIRTRLARRARRHDAALRLAS